MALKMVTIDLAKKFCFYPKEDCTELFSTFLAAAHQTEERVLNELLDRKSVV